MDAADVQEFRVGAVIKRGFSVFFKNIGAFVLLGAIVLSPLLVLDLVFAEDIAGAGAPGGEAPGLPGGEGAPDAALEGPDAVYVAVYAILQMLLTLLLAAAAVFLAFSEIRGGRASVGDALRVGLWRMIPVVGVAILVGLVLALAVIPVVLGSLLGVEPLGVLLAGVWGLLVMTVLWVAVPVAVVERPGIVASLRRSAALTSGYRWKVFAIIILLALINIVVAMVVGVVAVGALSVALGFYGVIIGQYLTNVVVSGIGAVMPAVAYHDLRTVKEGTDIDRLAAVFD